MAGLENQRRPRTCRVWTVAARVRRVRRDEAEYEAYRARRRQQVEDAIAALEEYAARIAAAKEVPPCL
jgi:hypothetical protein